MFLYKLSWAMSFMLGCIVFLFFFLFLNNTHLLSVLVGVEMMTLYTYMFMLFFTPLTFFFLIFLLVMACESALALVMFVIFNQYKSKDYVSVMSLLSF